MEDNQQVIEPKARKFRFPGIEAAVFVAGVLGAFTLSGFAHIQKYYSTLGVEIYRLGISSQQINAYGAAGLAGLIGAIVFGCALVGLVTLTMLLLENPDKPAPAPLTPPRWLVRVKKHVNGNTQAFVFVGILLAIALLFIVLWQVLVGWSAAQGRRVAIREVADCVESNFVYANLDRVKGCKVAETNDMMYLVVRDALSAKHLSFHTVEISKVGLKSVTGQSEQVDR